MQLSYAGIKQVKKNIFKSMCVRKAFESLYGIPQKKQFYDPGVLHAAL